MSYGKDHSYSGAKVEITYKSFSLLNWTPKGYDVPSSKFPKKT